MKENLSQSRKNKIFKNKNIYMQWNKLCKLNKFKESDHHRSLITYDDLDYDHNLTNEVKNAYYNKVIQIRKVMDKRNKDNLNKIIKEINKRNMDRLISEIDMRREIKKINEKIDLKT